jgi:transcription antitermination factor NusG
MQETPWCVLHVTANHEKRVAQYLCARLVEYYLPLYRERSKWTDRTVLIERPLFAGYVFVRFSSQARLSVISIPGVIRLLGSRDDETVSPEEIERLRKGLASGYILRPHSRVQVGTRVRVRAGVFEGAEGIVTELHNVCRVVISLAAVNQCFSLEVNIADLEVPKSLALSVDKPAHYH